MKKFFAVVICAVMIVSATACTGSNKGDNVESSAEIVNSTVSNDGVRRQSLTKMILKCLRVFRNILNIQIRKNLLKL